MKSFTRLEKRLKALSIFHCRPIKRKTTSNYTAILDLQGDMCLALADMSICEEDDVYWLISHEEAVKQTALVIADLNLPPETLQTLIQLTNLEKFHWPLFQ